MIRNYLSREECLELICPLWCCDPPDSEAGSGSSASITGPCQFADCEYLYYLILTCVYRTQQHNAGATQCGLNFCTVKCNDKPRFPPLVCQTNFCLSRTPGYNILPPLCPHVFQVLDLAHRPPPQTAEQTAKRLKPSKAAAAAKPISNTRSRNTNAPVRYGDGS